MSVAQITTNVMVGFTDAEFEPLQDFLKRHAEEAKADGKPINYVTVQGIIRDAVRLYLMETMATP